MDHVQCSACGLLAVRDEYGTGAIEATEHTRSTGTLQKRTGGRINAEFFCFAKSPAFPNLAYDGPDRTMFSPKPGEDPVVTILSQDRTCDCFRRWIPGKSPKEHEQMSHLEELELRTQAWRADDLKLQRQLRDDAERRHKEERRRHGMQLLVQTLLTIIVSVATLIAAKMLPWFH